MPLSFTDDEINDQAVRLGLIEEGQELPRNLRSKALAALVQQKAPQEPEASDPRVAKEISVQPNGVILVDGEPFPWVVARQPMDVCLDPDGFSTVRLTLVADTVEILKPAPSESENRA